MARTIIGIPTGNSNFLISEIVRTCGLPSRITHLKKHGMTHLIILWQMGNMLLSQPIFQYNFQYFVLETTWNLELTFHHFKYDFKTMTLQSRKTLQRRVFIQRCYDLFYQDS